MEVYHEVLTAIQELETEFKNTQIMAQNIGYCLPKLHALAQDLKTIKFVIQDLHHTANDDAEQTRDADTNTQTNYISSKGNKEYDT